MGYRVTGFLKYRDGHTHTQDTSTWFVVHTLTTTVI